MGTQQRYKVPLCDTAYRMMIERPGAAKNELAFGSNSFPEARDRYAVIAAGTKAPAVAMFAGRPDFEAE